MGIVEMRDPNIVYYGPHPCQRCDKDGKKGTMIVKAGNGAPSDMEYDFNHDSNYPNHVWQKHVCSEKSLIAMKLGSKKTPKKSISSKNNGKLGGRPKKK